MAVNHPSTKREPISLRNKFKALDDESGREEVEETCLHCTAGQDNAVRDPVEDEGKQLPILLSSSEEESADGEGSDQEWELELKQWKAVVDQSCQRDRP